MPIFNKKESGGAPGIIVLGAPRSGTTLLRRLIGAHPSICCPGETFLFKGAARFLDYDTISGGFDYGVLGALEGLGFERGDVLDRLRGFITGFYDELAEKEGKKRWAAKTAVDSFYLPQIEQLFAGHCKFICVTRHGLDVACSMDEFTRDLQTYVTELHEYIKCNPHPYEAFAQAWADVTGGIIDFSARHEKDCIMVRYEDLTADPGAVMKQITDFLGEPPLEKEISEILQNKNVGGIGDWKSFRKSAVETGSIGRWHDLPEAALARLAPIVNPVLQRAGYDPVGSGDEDDAQRRKELAAMLMQGRAE